MTSAKDHIVFPEDVAIRRGNFVFWVWSPHKLAPKLLSQPDIEIVGWLGLEREKGSAIVTNMWDAPLIIGDRKVKISRAAIENYRHPDILWMTKKFNDCGFDGAYIQPFQLMEN